MQIRISGMIRYMLSQLTSKWLPAPDPLDDQIKIHLATYQEVDWQRECLSHIEAWNKKVDECLFVQNTKLLSEKISLAIRRHLSQMQAANASMIFYNDKNFPALLRQIKDPPIAINILGNPMWLAYSSKISIVGARKATPFALRESLNLGRYFCDKGMCIVSGGAYGCDIAAHYGVLQSCRIPAPAILVFAGGFFSLHPKGNQHLFNELLDAGAALISERPWFYQVKKYDFPIRNRIIAGLSHETILVQASNRSGAMLTAQHALEYGREVYVSAGCLPSEAFLGNHKLLLEGAIGFEGVSSFIEKKFVGFSTIQ